MTTSHHLNIIYTHACTPELDGRPQKEEPVPMSGCDPDFGWSDGADGSGKCYMVIKNTDYTWVQHSADLSAMSNIAHSSDSYTTVLQLTLCVLAACAGRTTLSMACLGSPPWSAATTTRATSPSPRTRPSRTRLCSTSQQVQCSALLYSAIHYSSVLQVFVQCSRDGRM